MSPLVLSTASVPPHERRAFWNDMVCDVFVQLECDAARDVDFDGSIRSETLATLEISEVRSQAQRVMRTPRQIAKACEDYFLVSIQTEGRGVVRQDGREALLAPGDFALYDSTRPYELLFDAPFSQTVLMLPGAQLRRAMKRTEAITATTVSGREGAGHLLIAMIDCLRRDAPALQPESAAAVADSVGHILVGGLRTLPAARRQGASDLARYHVARIRQHVQRHLADPDLSVGSTARAVGLSMAHVHRLFQAEDQPLAHHIWSERLEACKRRLADPACAGQGVSRIAFELGFNDAAHFSRAFRARFGVSPREWRERALGR
ncbi:MAG: helix-turn-helix domain-containing protein [Betaproteobacteria bacterium]